MSFEETPLQHVAESNTLCWVPWCSSMDANTFLTDLIWRSHTPPMWLACGTFTLNSTQSQLFVRSSSLILLLSISEMARCSSFIAPIKFDPWSDCNCRTGPWRLTNWSSRRNQWSWYSRLQDGLLWKTDMWRVLCILCDHLWCTTDRSNLRKRTWTEEQVGGSPLANLPSSALREFLLTSGTSRILQCG